jgi:hypothetical protein
MLILQGTLFGTFTVVLVDNFPKFKKPFFNYVLVFAERPVSSFCKNFYLFLVRQLFCEGDSTAQTSKATL